MISESVEHQGTFKKAFGANSVTTGISTSISPLVLGFVADKFGIVNAFNISAIFALCAIVPAFLYHVNKNKVFN